MELKNRGIAIIYKGCLKKEPVSRIHKALYDATINPKRKWPEEKYLLAVMIKASNRARKISAEGGLLASALFDYLKRIKVSDKAKKVINHETLRVAEENKSEILKSEIEGNRDNGKWFYMASSHGDCAEDHKPYQGRLYVDEKAPKEAIEYARKRGLHTLQWVMGDPAWFVTRPNCRHYFKALGLDQVVGKTDRKLTRKYHIYSKTGNYDMQTPKKRAIEEYEDRLNMLIEMYQEQPNEKIEADILKTRLLLKKWRAS